MLESEIRYHPNVAAIVCNPKGEILICERLDTMGAWQFPQGSLEDGEQWDEALRRELWEEIGLRAEQFSIRERIGPFRYLYGQGRRKKGYHGKEQYYYLVDLLGPPSCITVATAHPEFRAQRWIRPEDFQLRWLPDMKKQVYRDVFQQFFALSLK